MQPPSRSRSMCSAIADAGPTSGTFGAIFSAAALSFASFSLALYLHARRLRVRPVIGPGGEAAESVVGREARWCGEATKNLSIAIAAVASVAVCWFYCVIADIADTTVATPLHRSRGSHRVGPGRTMDAWSRIFGFADLLSFFLSLIKLSSVFWAAYFLVASEAL